MVAKEVKTEMQEDMLEYAVETTRRAFDKYTTESEVAQFIKKEFDNQYNPTWHCIVGKTYGSFISYETGTFLDFVYGEKAILLFKAG
ncbi:Dynein light chain cytoplasmic [Fasciolopsis buskii]|uniref:Dynein light chain n=1 Tax=Fasciolopsis buskii TaxID=27845 RepID=A0A8E0S177_9TREM|nr:Dynein light chain cytoplasmic [Fasciolopsis buski]